MTDKEPSKSNMTEISEEQVWDILSFARESVGLGMAGMPISIDLLNQRLKDITLLSTGEVTEDEVTNALKAPKENEQELQRISESFEITSSLYKRLLSYIGNLPSFDYTYTCINSEKDDYSKSGYKRDLAVLREFMDSFDYKSEFSRVSRQLMRQESHFSVFRDTGDKFVLQELPSDRCKITGRWDYGLLFSFDYDYFLQGGVNIDFYPPIFKETLAKMDDGKIGGGGYGPSNSILRRGDYGFSKYADCSPIDGFWCFKFVPEIATRIPYFAGMFPDIVNEGTIRALQKNSYMAAASKILMGEVPMILDAKAAVKDRISISPELLGKFLALVQSAINSTSVKVAASPLQNVEGFDWESDNSIRSSFLRTSLGASGTSSNLLFANDIKQTVLETALSLNIDEILATSIYPQFNNFINWNVNKRTKKYKFSVKFEGTNIYTDRERRFENALELATRGIVLPQRIASAMGMSPFELEREMEMSAASGFVEKLTPIVISGQATEDASRRGRPSKSDTEISEEGSQTRETGANIEKKEL